LERVDRFNLKKITASSIDALVATVDNWYQAMVDAVVMDETKPTAEKGGKFEP
jgi:hypothetical protein